MLFVLSLIKKSVQLETLLIWPRWVPVLHVLMLWLYFRVVFLGTFQSVLKKYGGVATYSGMLQTVIHSLCRDVFLVTYLVESVEVSLIFLLLGDPCLLQQVCLNVTTSGLVAEVKVHIHVLSLNYRRFLLLVELTQMIST